MNILITGGAGYVGNSLLKALSDNYNDKINKIFIYDRIDGSTNLFFGDKKYNFKIEIINANILDNYSLANALDGIDVVYHLAAKVNDPYSSDNVDSFENINNWGTSVLVSEVQKAKVEKVIYLSTISVYGNSEKIIDTSDQCVPNSAYGISKYRGEKHIERLNESQYSIVRAGNVYGYNTCVRLNSVVNRFMFEAHHYSRINIDGKGDQSRGFINVDTLAGKLSDLSFEGESQPIINAVTNNYNLKEVASMIKDLYPEIETYFKNTHLPRRSVQVKTLLDCQDDMKKQLIDFKNNFIIGK